uniref:Uncharacterized protein n=1 Tax=Arundo donax TaxID=35708 RepID=A0A0A9FZY4_ARUDO
MRTGYFGPKPNHFEGKLVFPTRSLI